MAKQDFAQVKASTHMESESGSGSILSAIGIVAIAGLCFSGGYWLGAGDLKQTGTKTDTDAVEAKLAAQVAENKILQAKNESLQDLATQWKAKAEQGAHTKVGELTFYKELPKQSVTPAPVTDAPKVPPKTAPQHKTMTVPHQQVTAAEMKPAQVSASVTDTAQQPSNTNYRVQLASFRTRSDAFSMQQKLAQAGFVSQIRMADLGEKGRWYRLYAGPYSSISTARTTQQKIEKKLNLKGLLIRGE